MEHTCRFRTVKNVLMFNLLCLVLFKEDSKKFLNKRKICKFKKILDMSQPWESAAALHRKCRPILVLRRQKNAVVKDFYVWSSFSLFTAMLIIVVNHFVYLLVTFFFKDCSNIRAPSRRFVN